MFKLGDEHKYLESTRSFRKVKGKKEEKRRKKFLNEGKFGSINLIAYLCKRFIRV